MAEFFKAAFPWVVIGLAIAVVAANGIRNKKSKTADADDKEEKNNNCMSEGMCIGMCIGLVVGTTGVCDIATGLSLGMLVGEVAGMYIKK